MGFAMLESVGSQGIETSMSTSTPDPAAAQRPGLNQAVTGLVPPQVAEAHIRTAWPAVTDVSPGLAGLGAKLIRTKVLAPLAWLLLAPLYFKKIMPFVAKRYTLTNRRLMIQRGLKPKPRHEIALADIDDVNLVESSFSPFFRAADLEVISGGQVKLKLTGVPEPEAVRRSILNAVMAWVPGKAAKSLPMIPASAK
jgi:uncharacterized membrane protein YdbT with pleckstrin-like domain